MLIWQSFLSPEGELYTRKPFFDSEKDAQAHLMAWLSAAQQQSVNELAIRALVYHRAYSAAAIRVASTPSRESTSNVDVSTEWSDTRVKFFAEKAASYAAIWDTLEPTKALGVAVTTVAVKTLQIVAL